MSEWYNNWDVVQMNHYLQRHGYDAVYRDGCFVLADQTIKAEWPDVEQYVNEREQ